MFKVFNYLFLFNFLILSPVLGINFNERENGSIERPNPTTSRRDLNRWGSLYAFHQSLPKPEIDTDLLSRVRKIRSFVRNMETHLDMSLYAALKLLSPTAKRGVHHLWSEDGLESLEEVLKKRFIEVLKPFLESQKRTSLCEETRMAPSFMDQQRDDFPIRVLRSLIDEHMETAFLSADIILKRSATCTNEEFKKINVSSVEGLTQFMVELDQFRRVCILTQPASYQIFNPSVWKKRELSTVDQKGIFSMIDRLSEEDVNLLSEPAKHVIQEEKRHHETLEDKIQGLRSLSQRLRALEEAEMSKENSRRSFSPFKFLKNKKVNPSTAVEGMA